ncbi:MAG: hypothetical protein HY744_09790 [Deltaproteobacteria bacterium]|nr:hypothetical protein [Deltaproteobacteria bacterium]
MTIQTKPGQSTGALLALLLAAGCASTEFINEGPGQPTDRASGIAPAGSVGVCRQPLGRRPPLLSETLWEGSRPCRSRTPYRHVRLGYGRTVPPGADQDDQQRVDAILEAVREGSKEPDGNARMLQMMRVVRQYADKDSRLRSRVERVSGRTLPCDYSYLLGTMERQLGQLQQGERCTALAFDSRQRRDICMFETGRKDADWLTSAWGCFAFTGTVGEGTSCYQLCAHDDYCAAQVSCAAADLDLVLCALGVCLPEKVAGLY